MRCCSFAEGTAQRLCGIFPTQSIDTLNNFTDQVIANKAPRSDERNSSALIEHLIGGRSLDCYGHYATSFLGDSSGSCCLLNNKSRKDPA